MTRVAAVIVTYNRADKLATVLDHVFDQTTPVTHVIVVDNASTDHTRQVLDRYADRTQLDVIRMARNTGGAGGFAEGLARAHAVGADFAWVMDDDCYARPDALERLVAGLRDAEQALATPIVFAGSMVTWTDGSQAIMNCPAASDDWGDLICRGLPITLVDFCSFVSVLIPTSQIERHGLPLRRYFIWFDDAEYTGRLRHDGGRGIVVHDSVVLHDLGENKGVNVSEVDADNLWKFKYGARNESSFRWHHSRNKFGWLQFVLLTTVRMHRGGVRPRHRLTIYRKIIEGIAFNPKPEHVPARTPAA